MHGAVEPSFGTHALPGWLERLRRAGAGLGRGSVARRVTSLIRRICVAGRPDPFDVLVFPGQRARLYPRDNLSEKRVFGAPQFWDSDERAAIGRAMAAAQGPFRFVDAGANVGLYTLGLRSLGPIRALAIEPDPENLRRLRVNLAASGADDVTVASVALSDSPGTLRLVPGTGNRGETAVGHGQGGITVPARPLAAVVAEAGFDRIDALKIDIEGAEEAVLAAFLHDAPPALWPGVIVIEARRGAETPALALLQRTGYVLECRTRMNAVLRAPAARAAGRPTDKSMTDGKA